MTWLKALYDLVPKVVLAVLLTAMMCFCVALALGKAGSDAAAASARNALRAAQADLTTCRGNTVTLGDALSVSNAATEALRADVNRRAEAAAKAARDARNETAAYQRRAARAARQVSAEACGDDLILDSVR